MALLFSVGGALATVGPASAHRDGCHRWHSCPSDTGSYVCGDLGYYSECPGGAPEGADDSASTGSPDVDLDPPKKPKVADAVVAAGGRVRFEVRAERGATVVVRDERGRRLAVTEATGAIQRVRFRAADGTHVYEITAVDGAGNESTQRRLRLTVDAVRPPLSRPAVVLPRPADVGLHVTFSSEPGARFVVDAQEEGQTRRALTRRVTGRVPGAGEADALLRLPDGRYAIVVRVVDDAGNASRRSLRARVVLPAPLLGVSRQSALNESPVVWSVTASAGASGRFAWPGHAPVEFTADEEGRATVAVDLPDGVVPAAQVTVTDPLGRQVLARTVPFQLDRTPPRLDVQADREAAADGVLALRIAADPGSDVRVQVRRAGEQTVVASGVVSGDAAAGTVAWSSPVDGGDFVADVVTVDDAGNETRRSLEVEVQSPLTPDDVFALWVGLLLLQLVIGALVAAIVLSRPRLTLLLRRGRTALERRAEVRRYRAALDRHARALAAHEAETRRCEAAASAWQARSEQLDDLLELTQRPLPVTTPPAGSRLSLRPAERVHAVARAVLVEERVTGGEHRLVQVMNGLATVTDRRVVFEGDRQREWLFARVTEIRDLRPETVLLTVTNRKNTSGLRFTTDAERHRLLVALALADSRGSRAEVVALVQNLRAAHRTLRPTPPPAPPEPPAAPSGGDGNWFEIARTDLRGSSVPTGARGTHTG